MQPPRYDRSLRSLVPPTPCLYYHFGNKEGLYLELARVHFSKIDSLMEYYVSSSADSRRKLKELIDRTFCQVRKNSKFVRILNATYFGPPPGGALI